MSHALKDFPVILQDGDFIGHLHTLAQGRSR
jgi:hypothetical protein